MTTERHETNTQQPNTTTERARSSTERTKAAKFPHITNAHRKFLMCKNAKFPRAQMTTPEVSNYPEKHQKVSNRATNRGFYAFKQAFQVSISPETTPKFLHSTRPRFPHTLNDLSKFPYIPKEPKKFQRARTHPRFPHIHISTHRTHPKKCTFKVS